MSAVSQDRVVAKRLLIVDDDARFRALLRMVLEDAPEFAQWHERVVGILDPDEIVPHFLTRGKTVDPTGRFEINDLAAALPTYRVHVFQDTGQKVTRSGVNRLLRSCPRVKGRGAC